MDLFTLFPSFDFLFETSMYDRILNTDMEDWEHCDSFQWSKSESSVIDDAFKKLTATAQVANSGVVFDIQYFNLSILVF